jgi:hypothetical protein
MTKVVLCKVIVKNEIFDIRDLFENIPRSFETDPLIILPIF